MPARERIPCGRPTRRGNPCRIPPFVGTSGPCHHHAGLPPTQAQVAAARFSAFQHGFYRSHLLEAEEQALFEQVMQGILRADEQRARLIALCAVRAARLARWDAHTGKGSVLTARACSGLLKALQGPPPRRARGKAKPRPAAAAPPEASAPPKTAPEPPPVAKKTTRRGLLQRLLRPAKAGKREVVE